MPNFKRRYSEANLLLQLKRLAFDLGRTPLMKDMDMTERCPDSSTYATLFGSWNRALQKAGLTPSRVGKYSEEYLLKKLREFVLITGKVPTVRDIDNDKSMPSYSTYRKHFGSLYKAIIKAGLEILPDLK